MVMCVASRLRSRSSQHDTLFSAAPQAAFLMRTYEMTGSWFAEVFVSVIKA